MTILQATVLGIVQGLTEFLPVSSKTHLVVVPALLGWSPPPLRFLVFLHLGSLIALVAYFIKDLLAMLTHDRRTIGLIAVASVPAAVLGLLFEETFERLLSHPRGAAIALVATAALLVAGEIAAGTIGRNRLPRPLRVRVEVKDAVVMGIAQAFALLPGVSRSGSTMAAGLSSGIGRAAAARFSFLMALAAIAGANIIELPEVIDVGLGGPQFAGLTASLVSSYLVVAWLLRFLRRRTFLVFAAYCVVMAAVGAVRL